MAQLDATKNSDEVAYAFFKLCMRMDLARFHVGDVPRTELFCEQRGHNECVVKHFLEQVKSGEYSLGYPPGRHDFTALQIFEMIKGFAAASGTHLNVDSAKSLGHMLSKRYASLAPKVRSRLAK